MAVMTMIDYKTPLRIWKVRKIDLLPYAVAFFGTFYRLEAGVLAGAVVSLLVMVSYEVRPQHDIITSNDEQTVTLIFKGNLSYPAVECIKDTLNDQVKQYEHLNSVIIDMGFVYHIDYAVVNSLRNLIMELETDGISMDFVNFIDANVEESFKQGKLERKLALEKMSANEVTKDGCNKTEYGNNIGKDEYTQHLNAKNSDCKIDLGDVKNHGNVFFNNGDVESNSVVKTKFNSTENIV